MLIFIKVVRIFLNGIRGATKGIRHGHDVLLFWHMLKNTNFDKLEQFQKLHIDQPKVMPGSHAILHVELLKSGTIFCNGHGQR